MFTSFEKKKKRVSQVAFTYCAGELDPLLRELDRDLHGKNFVRGALELVCNPLDCGQGQVNPANLEEQRLDQG